MGLLHETPCGGAGVTTLMPPGPGRTTGNDHTLTVKPRFHQGLPESALSTSSSETAATA